MQNESHLPLLSPVNEVYCTRVSPRATRWAWLQHPPVFHFDSTLSILGTRVAAQSEAASPLPSHRHFSQAHSSAGEGQLGHGAGAPLPGQPPASRTGLWGLWGLWLPRVPMCSLRVPWPIVYHQGLVRILQ